MGRFNMHLRKFSNFLLSFRGLMIDFNFFVHSQQVYKRFPKRFPITTQFYPKLFGHSSSFVCITCNEGAKGSMTMILFWGMGAKGVFLVGSAQCSKKISDGPINVVF